MNRNTAFDRKIAYLIILVAMLVPLFLLGQPSSGEGDAGGQLTEMREKFNIAETDLGEISPASETMKLASLGLRGVAATLLWNKAHEYKVRNEWDRLKATLNNIALLQPHFDKVWEFQAWNLAYNVSIEFDDYRQRYEMVREGTEFLTKGVRQNRNAPRLIWYTGWFYGQKIGMSDEKEQFRRLFAEDEILHEKLLEEGIAVDSYEALGPLGSPDNWLVGRLWLHRGYDLVDSGIKIRRQTPINFYETGPKWRFKHAEAVEKEGILDERAQNAWQLAYEDWVAFGNRSIPTTSAFTVKLDQIEELTRQIAEKREQFKKLTKGVYEKAEQEIISTFSPEEQELLRKPESELSRSERNSVEYLKSLISPILADVARQADPEVRLEAIQLAGELEDLGERSAKTDGYRNQINYEYWKTLATAEQEERTVRARRLLYEAELANADAELDKAISLYEESFAIWADIFRDYPLLVIDDTAEDLYDSIRRYSIAIDSEEFPDDFPLKVFVDLMGEEGRLRVEAYEAILVTKEFPESLEDVGLLPSEESDSEDTAKETEEAGTAESADAGPDRQ